MKIRTRLLLFLLPTLIGGIALISLFFAYGWYSAGLFPAKLQECLFLIALSAGLTILVMVVTLYIIASNLSRPVQKLNNSALAIAAGQYGESIEVDGPKEIAELANTLNTMSECLHEQINRVEQNSKWKEKIDNEYECAVLLQHLMLQKNIDQCRSDSVAIQSITFFSDFPKGFLVQFPKEANGSSFQVHLKEAGKKGVEGMYQLLTQSKEKPSEKLTLDAASRLFYTGKQKPLIWSLDKEAFLTPSLGGVTVEAGDFFFLFNKGFLSFYRDPQRIAHLLSKVLKVFAQEGVKTIVAMLQKEIGFATKRRVLEEDLHLLCFQVLNS